ncbi:hypothetical protein GZL_03993 [Streptomyces sp. 769]|nr:hypothetical protein GZL_03993 [Streptomyces sp. 769]
MSRVGLVSRVGRAGGVSAGPPPRRRRSAARRAART